MTYSFQLYIPTAVESRNSLVQQRYIKIILYVLPLIRRQRVENRKLYILPSLIKYVWSINGFTLLLPFNVCLSHHPYLVRTPLLALTLRQIIFHTIMIVSIYLYKVRCTALLSNMLSIHRHLSERSQTGNGKGQGQEHGEKTK